MRVLTPRTHEMEREGYRANAGDRCYFCKAELLDVLSPLADAGLTKAQVREVSRRWGLPTWDKPAAACLSSRIAYGLEVTPAGLARVERAEEAVRRELAGLGLAATDLRVRDLGDTGSIELDHDLVLRLDAPAAAALTDAVRGAGFPDARLDPRGFRSGAMNERLPDPARWR